MNADEAREIIDSFAQDSPEAYNLALAASLAVRVEPELVRALRLNLFPAADAGAEADLWFSPLVQSQTPLALEFQPETLQLLRQDLAKDQELLRQTWAVLQDFHGSAPFALRLEEELTWLGLSGDSNQALIDKRWRSVLTAVSGGKRAGLARWATRALPSLPDKAKENDSARRLAMVAGMQTGTGPVLSAMPSQGISEDWLGEVTATKISRVKVGVRLLKNDAPDRKPPAVNVSGSTPNAPDSASNPLPMLIEFSYPPALSAEVIEVPDTYRLLLEVSWSDGEQRLLRRLSLLPDETLGVEVGFGEVNIRTALADIFTLRPYYEYDFMLVYDVAQEEWARNLVARLESEDRQEDKLVVTALPVQATSMEAPSLQSLTPTFGLSRKIGWAISSVSTVTQLEPYRPEPKGRNDWLIPIRIENTGANFLSDLAINFSGPGGFESGYRQLWKRITGEDLPLAETFAETDKSREAVSIFISYSHIDKKLRDTLLVHLDFMKRDGLVTILEDEVLSGEKWDSTLNQALETAQIILLLVSARYLASDYSGQEMSRAMERQRSGDARVIPIILQPTDWQQTPFAELEALPDNGRPVTTWAKRDDAFANVTEGILRVVEQLQEGSARIGASPFLPRPPVIGFVARSDSDGRDIVERLKEELAPRQRQTISLWGIGGSGKTTIAAEIARQLQSAYEGRIVWSSAEGRPDFGFGSLLEDIITQLGATELRPLALEAKAEALTSRFLVATNPTLVVLDGYEMIPSVEQERIESWLKITQCSLLITTRQMLSWTKNLGVSSMSREEVEEFLRRLIEHSREPQNFSNEVRQTIFQTAEGNPLVMQWVVGQIDLGQRPEAVLNELRHGQGAAAERVFDQAFNLPQLGEDGRAALLALSLFVSGAVREALAEVAGFQSDALRLDEALKNLQALSLIKDTDANQRVTVSGLTRELARSRLVRDHRAVEFRRRFVKYFLTYAEAYPEPAPKDYDALEVEKDNLLSAADEAFTSKDWSSVMSLAEVLTDPAGGFLTVRGYWNEAVGLGERALEAAQSSDNKAYEASFSFNLGATFEGRGELEKAEELYNRSLAIRERLGDDAGIAIALSRLGRVAQERGRLAEAEPLYRRSLDLNKKLDDQFGVAIALQQLGVLAQEQGRLEEAKQLYRESLEIQKRIGHQSGIATALQLLGSVAQVQHELKEAKELYTESLEIEKRIDDQRGTAIVLEKLGAVSEDQGQLDEARQFTYESLEIYRKLKDQNGIAGTLRELATLALKQGMLDEARRLYDESLTIYQSLGNQAGLADVLFQLGQLDAQAGNKLEAVRLVRQAHSIFERLQSPQAERARKTLESWESGSA